METYGLTSGDRPFKNETKNISSRISSRPVELDLEDLYCILQIQPYDSFMALELSERLRARGRLEEALKVLRGLIKIDSRFETLQALGQLEYSMELIDEAFLHLQQAMLIAPESAPQFELFKTMGNIFVRRGDFESAEDSYNKAYRLNPDSDVLHVNLGTLSIQRMNWDESLERFRKALDLNTRNDKAWVGLAIGHRMKGDMELAWGNLEASLEYNSLNEVALGLALEWGIREGRESRILEHLRQFLIGGGWNEKLSLAFVWLCHRRGETQLARLELERVLAVNPQNNQALGLVHELRGTI